MLKRNYLPHLFQLDNLQEEQEVSFARGGDDPTYITAPAFPQVQPLKAALHFESAEGFGEWQILIGDRANGVLRETRKKDAKLLKIYLKKIRCVLSAALQRRSKPSTGNSLEAISLTTTRRG